MLARFDFEISKFRNAFEALRSASLGPEIERPSTRYRYQPLGYSGILPRLTVRPFPTQEAPWHMAARVLWMWYIHGGLVFETRRSASLGSEIERPSTRYKKPLDYSRILPWLIARPCPTLESTVAHSSKSFVGVVHSRRGVCVCFLPIHSEHTSRRSLDVPAGVTQEEGHTGFSPTFFLRCVP